MKHAPPFVLISLALGCSAPPLGGLEAAPFCEDLCAAYLPCADGSNAPSDVATPLFCGGAPSTRAERCQSICGDAIARLGESQGVFLDCATCALPYTTDIVCDPGEANDVGGVACKSVCTVSASDPVSVFEDDFQAKMAADDMTRCAPGTVVIAAADPSVEHPTGHSGPNDTWACSSDMECSSGYLVKGPSVRLAPGSYTLGVQGLVAQAGALPLEARIWAEVHFGEDASVSLTAEDFAQGTASVELTLTEVQEVEVRLHLYTAVSASVEAIFITRH